MRHVGFVEPFSPAKWVLEMDVRSVKVSAAVAAVVAMSHEERCKALEEKLLPEWVGFSRADRRKMKAKRKRVPGRV